MTGTRSLRLAGVQMTCRLGRRAENLSRAEEFATRAAAQGAQLILFPELMGCGYSFSSKMWRGVEPPNGPTVRWLCETAAALRVHLGTTVAELDGHHVYNTFVLAGPDGEEAGRVRKSHVETYLFRAEQGPHVIDCALGRIGVGICADNQYSDFARLMRRARPDVLLMPHAGPAAHRVGGMVSEADVREQHDLLAGLAGVYAGMLGAPVLFVNQYGPTVGRPGSGILGSIIDTAAFHFPGLSTLVDSDGRIVASLAQAEGVVCGEVTVDPLRYPDQEPCLHGRYAVSSKSPMRRALFAIDGGLGRLSYARGRRGVRVAPENV